MFSTNKTGGRAGHNNREMKKKKKNDKAKPRSKLLKFENGKVC